MSRELYSDGKRSLVDVAIVYKLTTAAEWREAVAVGAYAGSADDLRDGFVHLSTAAQLPATAAKYFRGIADLVLVAVDVAVLGADLWWEPSRGGDLFPHLYAPLPVSAALWARPVALDPAGLPLLPEDLH